MTQCLARHKDKRCHHGWSVTTNAIDRPLALAAATRKDACRLGDFAPCEGKTAQKARDQVVAWLEKGIDWRVVTGETDTDVRGLGAMEGCQAHLITDRMTDRGMSWCRQSARNLGKVIQLHAEGELGRYVVGMFLMCRWRGEFLAV